MIRKMSLSARPLSIPHREMAREVNGRSGASLTAWPERVDGDYEERDARQGADVGARRDDLL